ncbi:DUF2798 domain-containing protein [Terribacillus sp. DMT04]|uniref:DUF2798 domain-containing protein n=1 Tax=Terribacillus sp. DMT04 TaxID=2850441 RepID=UPI001C2C1F4F|nr:DUF2798 domain-containing protein [Terribacillus sp. DMT04]QXE00276.1 DUF2798 domain-containing protein [Terribacillus sp. DMT04]
MFVNLKTHRIVCSFLTAAIMTAIISFTLTAVNSGLHAFSYHTWFRSWIIAFLLVFTISFFLPKLVHHHVSRVVRIKE